MLAPENQVTNSDNSWMAECLASLERSAHEPPGTTGKTPQRRRNQAN